MVRLTIYFKKFPKLSIDTTDKTGKPIKKKKVFNVKTLHHVLRADIPGILAKYDKSNVLKHEVVCYS